MSVLLDAISPQVLQVGLVTLPTPIAENEAREAFGLLGGLGYDTYRTVTRGTVIGASADDDRRLMLMPTSRFLELPLPATGLKEAMRLAVDTFDILTAALPKADYEAVQISLTSHIPVEGQTAAAAMSHVALRDPAALQPLGRGVAAGLRIFLADTSSLVIEPYVDEANTIFLQYVTVASQESNSVSLEPALRTAVEFHNGPVLEMLTLLFKVVR